MLTLRLSARPNLVQFEMGIKEQIILKLQKRLVSFNIVFGVTKPLLMYLLHAVGTMSSASGESVLDLFLNVRFDESNNFLV